METVYSRFMKNKHYLIFITTCSSLLLVAYAVPVAVFLSENGQATKRRSSHTSGQVTREVQPLYFGNMITRTLIPHICVSLIFPSQKTKMASIKDFICEASAFVKANFDVTNLPTDDLNNFIGEMFLFYKGNFIIENTSGNKHVFKVTL